MQERLKVREGQRVTARESKKLCHNYCARENGVVRSSSPSPQLKVTNRLLEMALLNGWNTPLNVTTEKLLLTLFLI